MTYALETDDWSYFEDIATKHHTAGDEFIEIPDSRVDEFCRLFYDCLIERKKEHDLPFAGWFFREYGPWVKEGEELVELLGVAGKDGEPIDSPEELATIVRAFPDKHTQALMYRALPVKVIK